MTLQWQAQGNLVARSYVCGYCNHRVGPTLGWQTNQAPQDYIYLCSFCGKPTFFRANGKQSPGVAFGNVVDSLPPDVAALYDEARSSMTVGAFTSSVLTCRKLLMHLAVEKGAAKNKSFLEYVEYLENKGYIPPDGKGWVDYIRTKGNEATHEIKIMSEADAKDLIQFSEMLLKIMYEFPARVPPRSAATMVASSAPAAGPVVASPTSAKPSVP
jgi:hypothetical protein